MTTINTVTGSVQPQDLGVTLLHEHLSIGLPGWETDGFRSTQRSAIIERCVSVAGELVANGIRTILDPCANDIGRDVELMAEVSARSGLNIVCATGLFNDVAGGSAYWRSKMAKLEDPRQLVPYLAELLINEITEGVGATGIRAGVIKVATGFDRITPYERLVFEAAARAAIETGVPITTHTECGVLGREQQALLTSHGVPADRIIIGHSCGSTEPGYHADIVGAGSFVGFDQFGYEGGRWPRDEQRLEALGSLFKSGARRRLVIATDNVMCVRGAPYPNKPQTDPSKIAARTLRVLTYVFPYLRSLGVSEEHLSSILIDTPRNLLTPGA
ncbi:MAG TPA: hypothetical protein PK286_09145 [Devosia sp.]|nr:hypothetical protein [Devosia sp.]